MAAKNTNANKSRDTHFYPGRDAKFNYIAIPAANFLLHGSPVDVRVALLQNLIIRTVEEQASNTVRIHIVDASNQIAPIYKELEQKGRDLPHLAGVTVLQNSDDKLGVATEMLDQFLAAMTAENQPKYSTIYVLAGFDEVIKNADAEPGRVREFYNKLKQCLKTSLNSDYIFVADFGDKSLPDDIITAFAIRACVKTSNIDMSHKLVGSDIAYYYDGDSKYIWIKQPRLEMIRLYVPRRPDAWNRNMLFAFAQNAEKPATKKDKKEESVNGIDIPQEVVEKVIEAEKERDEEQVAESSDKAE